MRRYVAVLPLVFVVLFAGCASLDKKGGFGLDDVQGYWWESCDDPAVQFAIQGDRYFGDFEGEFKVRVEDDTLVIDQLPPLSAYRIVAASSQRIILRPVIGSARDWVLQSCAGHQAMSPDNSFRSNPLRGSASIRG